MEFLKASYGPNFKVGDALLNAANVGFVAGLTLIIFVWQLPLLALVLAVASKWRILAVRPRFWSANLRSNLIDLLFIFSATALVINPQAELGAQLFWMLLLAGWLLVLKPLSKRPMMLLQAGMGQFVVLTALLTYASYITINQLYILVVVLGAWLVGYASARHALSSYEKEPKLEFFALLWGFVVAQLAWLFSHWLQVYALLPGIEIPQLALLLLLLSFCTQRAYSLQRLIRDHDDPNMERKATRQELRGTYGAMAFAASFMILILATSNWTITI